MLLYPRKHEDTWIDKSPACIHPHRDDNQWLWTKETGNSNQEFLFRHCLSHKIILNGTWNRQSGLGCLYCRRVPKNLWLENPLRTFCKVDLPADDGDMKEREDRSGKYRPRLWSGQYRFRTMGEEYRALIMYVYIIIYDGGEEAREAILCRTA